MITNLKIEYHQPIVDYQSKFIQVSWKDGENYRYEDFYLFDSSEYEVRKNQAIEFARAIKNGRKYSITEIPF